MMPIGESPEYRVEKTEVRGQMIRLRFYPRRRFRPRMHIEPQNVEGWNRFAQYLSINKGGKLWESTLY
jgi:hypothetical protein